ncbi:hypothetical protein HRM2_19130 [Desulforapulum autotrophicum HRM2]|uniref:Restriction endonuclease n=1 Tax=Desulforapulum autotrophicum (strain ATCC 43914 / DSM 3382 / VKM B-1955 / HRM2) TaxID=177437 RepID=C0QC02_DESAH|nr:hypothetical protein [Desulforapulum autotrophicum]ACN15014.1 hypothetical protein HRM2_19130 [Desulforapulum autotrophicum HRM2]
MRIEQPKGDRGSLKWIQRLIQNQPFAVNDSLRKAGALSNSHHIEWLSPLREDVWAEYRDLRWLKKIGQAHLSQVLKNFWPRRGPQWDALAKDETGRVFLFEAKAHSNEMKSNCQAGVNSKRIITNSLNNVKAQLGANQGTDWLCGYYQYANRLAHLYMLREHDVDAWMVFLYFCGDSDMLGPESEIEWRPHIEMAHKHLGLNCQLPYVVSLFYDVDNL